MKRVRIYTVVGGKYARISFGFVCHENTEKPAPVNQLLNKIPVKIRGKKAAAVKLFAATGIFLRQHSVHKFDAQTDIYSIETHNFLFRSVLFLRQLLFICILISVESYLLRPFVFLCPPPHHSQKKNLIALPSFNGIVSPCGRRKMCTVMFVSSDRIYLSKCIQIRCLTYEYQCFLWIKNHFKYFSANIVLNSEHIDCARGLLNKRKFLPFLFFLFCNGFFGATSNTTLTAFIIRYLFTFLQTEHKIINKTIV